MEEPDYKLFTFELISALKAKAEYLKSIDANSPEYKEENFEGMKLAYHFVLDEVKSLAENFQLPLDEYGLDDYEPNEILGYKPNMH